ncbi:hypothetical protein JCM5296_006712 [Sporobolomyces johnsonii]
MANGLFVANLVISVLSVLGAVTIIVGSLVSSQRQHLRQKVLLGMGLTDLVQGMVTLVGNARELRNEPYITNSPGCLASGFFYQVCVVAGATWTLVIACVTFLSLSAPLSRAAALNEHRFTFHAIVGLVLLVSIPPAIPTTTIYDMVDVGGVCWLRNGTMPSNLMLFVPRASALVCVIGLYTRLFIFFRRRDISALDTSRRDNEEATEVGEAEGGVAKRFSLALSTKLSSWGRRSLDQHSQHSHITIMGPTDTNLSAPLSLGTRASLSPIPGSPVNEPDPSAPFSNLEPKPPLIPPTHSFVLHFAPKEDETPFSSTSSSPAGELNNYHLSPTKPPDTTNSLVDFSALRKGDRDRSPAATLRECPPTPRDPTTSRRRPLSPRELNRRLALLFGLFPLAYSALVAVSIARLVQQLATTHPAHPTLTNISRWLIYSQGLIDGLLFSVMTFFKWSANRGTWEKRRAGPRIDY